ncbi:MAG: hypothetical protein ACPG7F_12385 [Aggregatilineales bacterium]
MAQQLPTKSNPDENWKQRMYITGAMVGAIIGFVSAYLFTRSAEENDDGKPPEVTTGTLISLFLAVMGLVRQIAETGKSRKK